MESQQVGNAPQNVQVHPNNEFIQYMQINADFMNGLSRQFEISNVVSRIHHFTGNNPSRFRLWMKHLRREALEKQPIDYIKTQLSKGKNEKISSEHVIQDNILYHNGKENRFETEPFL